MTHFNQRHGAARPGNRTGTYRSWECAKARCRNPNNPDFHNYGGRGIVFDVAWDRFEDFLADMGERPQGHTLERKDSNGPYAKKNCVWATQSRQQRNKCNNRRVDYEGRTITMVELSEQTGKPYQLLYDRIVRRGWAVRKAVET